MLVFFGKNLPDLFWIYYRLLAYIYTKLFLFLSFIIIIIIITFGMFTKILCSLQDCFFSFTSVSCFSSEKNQMAKHQMDQMMMKVIQKN